MTQSQDGPGSSRPRSEPLLPQTLSFLESARGTGAIGTHRTTPTTAPIRIPPPPYAPNARAQVEEGEVSPSSPDLAANLVENTRRRLSEVLYRVGRQVRDWRDPGTPSATMEEIDAVREEVLSLYAVIQPWTQSETRALRQLTIDLEDLEEALENQERETVEHVAQLPFSPQAPSPSERSTPTQSRPATPEFTPMEL
jgi:hypothetical protein